MALTHAIRYFMFMAYQGISQRSATNKKPTLEDLKQYRFDPAKALKEPIPVLSLTGIPLCTTGNISNIQGQAKSAKTSVLGAAMAAMLRALTGKTEDNSVETLHFTSNLPANTDKSQKVILHFDTEQSTYHHHKLAMDIIKRAGIEQKEYPNLPFYSYSLIRIEYTERRRLIDETIADIERQGRSIACLVLDGVADMVSDPNNFEESSQLVEMLHALADTKNCTVLTIIHENPGEGAKARGHLGSQIQRKSETNLRVKKVDSLGQKKPSDRNTNDSNKKPKAVTHIWVERARGADIPEKDAVKISWCKTNKRHLLDDRPRKEAEPDRPREISHPNVASQETAQQVKLTKRDANWKAMLEQLLTSPMNHTPLKAMVMKKTSCKERTAIKRINDWIEKGWIHKLYPEMKQTPYGFGPTPVGKKKRQRTPKQEGETTAKKGFYIKKKSAAKKAIQNSTEKTAATDLPKEPVKEKMAQASPSTKKTAKRLS
jgi:hypothetical protein